MHLYSDKKSRRLSLSNDKEKAIYISGLGTTAYIHTLDWNASTL